MPERQQRCDDHCHNRQSSGIARTGVPLAHTRAEGITDDPVGLGPLGHTLQNNYAPICPALYAMAAPLRRASARTRLAWRGQIARALCRARCMLGSRFTLGWCATSSVATATRLYRCCAALPHRSGAGSQRNPWRRRFNALRTARQRINSQFILPRQRNAQLTSCLADCAV